MGAPKQWNLERLGKGFQQFFSEHDRLPTSNEVDKTDYLPSTKQIQRVWGGLPNLRKMLGYEDIHFGKGKFRSKISLDASIAGRKLEIRLEKIQRFS